MSNGLYAAIAQGGAPIQIQDPVNQMARVMAIKNAQQEGQLNALRMAEAQAGAEETGRLRNVLSQFKDLYSPEAQAAIMGTGLKGLEYAKGLTAAQKSAADLAKAQFDLVKDKTTYFRDQLGNVNTPQDAQLWTAALYSDPVLSPVFTKLGGTVQQAIARIPSDPAAFAQWKNQAALGAQRFIELNAPKITTQGFGGGERLLATPGLGGPATEVAGSRIARTVSPDTAARLAQERDIGLQTRIAEAKEYGQTLGKSRATAEASLPGAVATAEQTINLIDQMIGKPTIKDANGKVIQKGTAPHPGFSSYVGATLTPGARFVEGSSTADFERYQLQVEGKAFLEAFEALRGGGAITEIEGAKGTQAIMRMNKAQSEREYMKAARELQDIVRKGVEKARAKAGVEAPAAPAAAPAAPAAAPMAPMYARNPQTGQRIMSTDGGVTWNPAR
jgi:hypothetical protein